MRRAVALAALGVLAATAGGCGLGSGKGTRGASAIVTRDFGSRLLASAHAASLPGAETQMRFLQRRFRVQTRYGGGYVQSIDGLTEGRVRGRPHAWLYYVNGIAAPRGAASTPVHAGDRIWWDFHDYGAAVDTPSAVVGAFPSPFLHDIDGKRPPTRLECAGDAGAACAQVARRLTAVGVVAPRSVLGTGAGKETLRVLVGTWSSLRRDNAAEPLERGPAASGVWLRPAQSGRRFAVLDPAGHPARTVGAGTGVVAVTKFEDQEPAWLVTGTDARGVGAAAAALTESDLERRFALVIAGGQKLSAPAVTAP